jgi:hypothetical protein
VERAQPEVAVDSRSPQLGSGADKRQHVDGIANAVA